MDDFQVAALAIAGTLLGAIVTGALTLIATALAGSSARRTKTLELEHSASEADRAERRQLYKEFIDYMEQWRFLAPDVYLLHAEFDPPSYVEPDPRGYFTLMVEDIPLSHPKRAEVVELERLRNEVWERWRKCLGALRITGSLEVSHLAWQLFHNDLGHMDAAWDGEPYDFDSTLPSAVELIGVMRFDLGLEDGYTLTEEVPSD